MIRKLLFLLFAFFLSCSDELEPIERKLGLSYQGQTYRTVDIGDQTWMAENLNYAVTGSACYNGLSFNCDRYGRLYSWKDALKVCPPGWRLPSYADWSLLTNFVGDSAGIKLKTTSGWNNDTRRGTDIYAFSALPGGSGVILSGGSFYPLGKVGEVGYWWTSTEFDEEEAYYRAMYSAVRLVYGTNDPMPNDFLFSVRCLQDKSSSSSSYTSAACDNAIEGNGTVTCGDQTYKTVVIGEQTWMAENLNYQVEGSKCVPDDGDVNLIEAGGLCSIYGRLYSWAAAMDLPSNCNTENCNIQPRYRGVCPEGWHIPLEEDWDRLILFADNLSYDDYDDYIYESSTAGQFLKDTSGFHALMGGFGYSSDEFSYVNERSNWWSSYESGEEASARTMRSENDRVEWRWTPKANKLSIRCVKD